MAESLQNLKRRIAGVKNVNQITKAMELVAATKMRKSQEIALSSRPYAYAALRMLHNLLLADNVKLPSLLLPNDSLATAMVLITSDKGLAGSFNSNTIKHFDAYADAYASEGSVVTIGVGQKAIAHLEKKGMKPSANFTRIGDYTTIEEVSPVAKYLTDGYLNGAWGRVIVFSMNFESALVQKPVHRTLLPARTEDILATLEAVVPQSGKYAEYRGRSANGGRQAEYIIEPSPEAILDDLARHLVLMQIYHLVLEANASEHAARRAAMKSASDNAKELAGDLLLEYNKSRQASITREIIEITAGAEALN